MKNKLFISGLCVVGFVLFLISGCCPYSKKVAQPKETKEPVEQTFSIKKPDIPKPDTKQQSPSVKPPADTGTATPEEIKIATTGGELPPAKPEEDKKFVEPGDHLKEIFQPVYFDFDRYNIKTSEQGKLKNLADYLKKNPDVSILIEGHCDERGTDEYNLVLGEKRALSTRAFLVGLGISPKRIYTISYGEARPADPGHNEEAWAKNRRAEFKIKQ